MENQINVENCTSAIGKIEEDIVKMQNCISNLQSDASSISHAWVSDNATAFIKKVDEILNNLHNLKQSIANINAAVQKTKDEIVKVDAITNN